MFPKAPDKRLLLNKTIITNNLANTEPAGLRLFGFIIPEESGLYFFAVQFCSAEVWLSHNENWRNARKIWEAGKLSQEKKDFNVSGKIGLVAGQKYFIEVVATCFRERNKIQLLWKIPTSSAFEIINGTFLSHYVDDSGLNDSKIYDESLPDSPVCASRRTSTTYFQVQREISYLSHGEVKDILPYCEYKPSYTVNHRLEMWHAVSHHVVHSFIYPFPEHINLKDAKHWIYPLGEDEAFKVVHIFMESVDKKISGKFALNEIRNVERKTDPKRGNRYLIEVELLDLTNNRKVLLSEYVFMPNGTKKLCYPKDFQWNRTVNVYLIVTAKNLGRWVHHFIKNVERILNETNDPNLHVIIYDYNCSDINLEKVLKESSLTNYMFLRESGGYSRTRSFTEAINLVSDPHSIIFMLDLHLDIGTPFINNIRKHCIEGRMMYTPIIIQMKCGSNPANLAGIWQTFGYGIIGMYKSDWDRSGGFSINKNTWGGEDWILMDQLVGVGLEFERMRTTHVYHYHHSKNGLWTGAS
ncbi:hypothetical protein OS493_008804 [Desmophyllum pertusum]|uniref:Hexosyltransferase n=1 Tax=Desmophyllum pertusum TaxID=174260 RepID=A0A9X0CY75_9CNID|nr:hypothetical protein OS493_008804 [Desmophyllum pertusum]